MIVKLRCEKCGANFESIIKYKTNYSCPNCGENKEIIKIKK